MPSQIDFFRITLGGGLSTERGPFVIAGVGVNNTIEVPYLTRAENIQYRTSNAWQKIGGAAILNTAAAIESISGLYDYWKGAGTDHAVVVKAETKIYTMDNAGTMTSRATGLAAGGIPNFSQLDDLCIIANSNADVPRKWNGTAVATLGTNTPNFSFSRVHKNRLWAAGVSTNPSRVYYSQHVNEGGPDGDWDGVGAGFIDISPNDGDAVRAFVSFNNEIFVFKGPYKGRIYRIAGSAPTGDNPFQLVDWRLQGIGSPGQNSIFSFRNDIGFFCATTTVRSLQATDAQGDFFQTQLSRDIDIYLKENVLNARLDQAWSAADTNAGVVRIMLVGTGKTVPNLCLSMDYRWDPPRWSFHHKIAANCVTTYVDDANDNNHLMLTGGNDGYVRKLDQSARRYEVTPGIYEPIEEFVEYPFLDFGAGYDEKSLIVASLSLAPKGNYSAEFRWRRDDESVQTRSVSQQGGAFLDSFVLDSDILGGSDFVDRFMEPEDGGKFRTLSLGVRQVGLGEDIEVYALGVGVRAAGKSASN